MWMTLTTFHKVVTMALLAESLHLYIEGRSIIISFSVYVTLT